MKTNAYDESRRIVKVIFNEVYSKTFNNRKECDDFVMDVVKKNKIEGVSYTYSSLYLYKNYTIHVNVVYDGCISTATFSFNMIWNDEKFQDKYNMDNIATYIGTPAYWFGRSMKTDEMCGVIDEKIVEL